MASLVCETNDNDNEPVLSTKFTKKLKVNFHLYQPTLFLPKLSVDQLTFIFQSASKPFERAHIIGKIVKHPNSNFRGRLQVKYTNGQQSTYYVRPKNIIKVMLNMKGNLLMDSNTERYDLLDY